MLAITPSLECTLDFKLSGLIDKAIKYYRILGGRPWLIQLVKIVLPIFKYLVNGRYFPLLPHSMTELGTYGLQKDERGIDREQGSARSNGRNVE